MSNVPSGGGPQQNRQQQGVTTLTQESLLNVSSELASINYCHRRIIRPVPFYKTTLSSTKISSWQCNIESSVPKLGFDDFVN